MIRTVGFFLLFLCCFSCTTNNISYNDGLKKYFDEYKVDGCFATRNGDQELTEKQLSIIDELERLAEVHSTTPAAIALSWVNNKPGVTSTIIGVRTEKQLDANIAAVDVHLTTEEIASLDQLSMPQATFLSEYKDLIKILQHGGIEINGLKPTQMPMLADMQPGKY